METKFFGLFVCVTSNFGVQKVLCYVCVQVRYLMDMKKKTRRKKTAEAEFSHECNKTISQKDESVRSTEASRTKRKREKKKRAAWKATHS